MSSDQFATVVEKIVTAAYDGGPDDTAAFAAYAELLSSLNVDELFLLVTLLLGWIARVDHAALGAFSAEHTAAVLGRLANLLELDLQLEGLLP